MTEELNKKYEMLKEYFKQLGSAAIAFSSGVDSTFMLKVAHDVLGDKAVKKTKLQIFAKKKALNIFLLIPKN